MIRATSAFQSRDSAAFLARIVPRIVQAVTQGTQAVFDESQNLVPISTEQTRPGGPHGELKASGKQAVAVQGYKVVGSVEYGMPYAAFVEFGTGRRGAESPGAGPYQYTESWPGMRAQPYCRPALDMSRPAILSAFAEAGFDI